MERVALDAADVSDSTFFGGFIFTDAKNASGYQQTADDKHKRTGKKSAETAKRTRNNPRYIDFCHTVSPFFDTNRQLTPEKNRKITYKQTFGLFWFKKINRKTALR